MVDKHATELHANKLITSGAKSFQQALALEGPVHKPTPIPGPLRDCAGLAETLHQDRLALHLLSLRHYLSADVEKEVGFHRFRDTETSGTIVTAVKQLLNEAARPYSGFKVVRSGSHKMKTAVRGSDHDFVVTVSEHTRRAAVAGIAAKFPSVLISELERKDATLLQFVREGHDFDVSVSSRNSGLNTEVTQDELNWFAEKRRKYKFIEKAVIYLKVWNGLKCNDHFPMRRGNFDGRTYS
ncbi:hypothetical protein DIPPA_28149 [Diplonema papillatum]|nr:hypothetical protein DIPPA_28149 [Diplonema papillatum]